MSKANLDEKLRKELLARSAGRCQLCGKFLLSDDLTGLNSNFSECAHIIGASSSGPRGNELLSAENANSLSNIMLLCQTHHKLIDSNVNEYPVELLKNIKEEFESGIDTYVNKIVSRKKTVIVIFKSNIGIFKNIIISENDVYKSAYENGYYVIKNETKNLSISNIRHTDDETNFWQIEVENLQKTYEDDVSRKIVKDRIEHISVFAIAPQPLLVKLGTLITDINSIEVFQKHREPDTWSWNIENSDMEFEYEIEEPSEIKKNIALVLSLSADINDDRIFNTLGNDTSIWKIKVKKANNDFLRTKEQLGLFREKIRYLYNEIKKKHGEEKIINVFPAVPVAIAIEIGRVRMPKADLPLKIYDQNEGKFIEAITII